MKYYRGELVIAHPDFPSGSSATPKASEPVDINTPDIIYTKDDDAAIDKFHRETGEPMLFYSITQHSNASLTNSRNVMALGNSFFYP